MYFIYCLRFWSEILIKPGRAKKISDLSPSVTFLLFWIKRKNIGITIVLLWNSACWKISMSFLFRVTSDTQAIIWLLYRWKVLRQSFFITTLLRSCTMISVLCILFSHNNKQICSHQIIIIKIKYIHSLNNRNWIII